MASPKRKQGSNEPNLTTRSDFQLLNDFSSLVGSHPSEQLKSVAWEIMRRYTSHLEAGEKAIPKDYNATLGDARWGDAKRVEAIFGIRRNKLLRMQAKGQVKTVSLGDEKPSSDASASAKAKRLYCLVSILNHIESKSAEDS